MHLKIKDYPIKIQRLVKQECKILDKKFNKNTTINGLFDWEDTRQGYRFWADINYYGRVNTYIVNRYIKNNSYKIC